MTKMTIKAARAKLQEALIEDKVSDAQSNESVLRSFITDGFQGFNRMTYDELVQCAYDAGLVRDGSEVSKCVDVLKDMATRR